MTIIILLVLSGVAINSITSENGLLKNAKQAKNITEEERKQEDTKLSEYKEKIEEITNESYKKDDISSNIPEFTPIIKQVSGNYIQIGMPEIKLENSIKILGYAYIMDGKVKKVTDDSQYTISNLEQNHLYTFQIMAIDENGKIKVSNAIKQKTEEGIYLYN